MNPKTVCGGQCPLSVYVIFRDNVELLAYTVLLIGMGNLRGVMMKFCKFALRFERDGRSLVDFACGKRKVRATQSTMVPNGDLSARAE